MIRSAGSARITHIMNDREEAPGEPEEIAWKDALNHLAGVGTVRDEVAAVFGPQRSRGEVRLEIDLEESRARDTIVLDVLLHDASRANSGFRSASVDSARRALSSGGAAARAFGSLLAASTDTGSSRASQVVVAPELAEAVVPDLCACGLVMGRSEVPGRTRETLRWDPRAPFGFRLVVSEDRAGGGYVLDGRLTRDQQGFAPTSVRLVLSCGLLWVEDRLSRVELDGAFDWVERLSLGGPVRIPRTSRDAFLVELAGLPNVPDIDLPASMHWSQVRIAPTPCVVFERPEEDRDAGYVVGRVSFEYGSRRVSVGSNRTVLADGSARRLFSRDRAKERHALRQLRQQGLEATPPEEASRGEVRVRVDAVRGAVQTLLADGWRIDADGGRVRTAAGPLVARVQSGIDWFDLEAELDYDGVAAPLPELLAATARSAAWVRLSDGTRGLLPDWLDGHLAVCGLGELHRGKVRFDACQAGVLDALLTGQVSATVDVKFDRIRCLLRQDPARVREPEGFEGTLRDYQREGVGWLEQLAELGYGGCLADDMGLGKTVQILAFLQGRHGRFRAHPGERRPSIVVVPKSLVGNWLKEAGRFTPGLRAVAYTGASRTALVDVLVEYDVIVTTYGTLRRDILRLSDIPFEWVILDEAQAIKNPSSLSAKACRLLMSRGRLAISGTPVENSLRELWSIFEFLNPGMLGALDRFEAADKAADDDWLERLSASLAPFMLRRTKEQVLGELPEKTEQTLFVELEGEERRQYDELLEYFRSTLTLQIGDVGLGRSRMHVLEALLRLRQAACHVGLIDPERAGESSAKLDALLLRLEELAASNHKALVFSQFTTLLGMVQRRLEARGIAYAYLDGQTRDRQGVVDHFQTDPDCKAFLISLKAGGCGLTLTASDYVFILDPWWNPAVEAQAIDRAHRMGQTRPVFAYRLIARGTVEEKIVQLQDEKRRLADAVIGGDRSVMKDFSMEDFARLFGT